MLSNRPNSSRSIVKVLAWLFVPYCTMFVVFGGFSSFSEGMSEPAILFRWSLLILLLPAAALALCFYTLETRFGLLLLSSLVVVTALVGLLIGRLWVEPVILSLVGVCLFLDAPRYLHFARLSHVARSLRKHARRATALARLGAVSRSDPDHLRLAIENVGSGSAIGWTLATLAGLVMWIYVNLDQGDKNCFAMALAAIVASLLGSAAASFFRPKYSVQNARDHIAERLGQAILNSSSDLQVRYAIYLRPFDVTGRLLDKKAGRRWYFLPVFPQYYANRIVELEVPLGDTTWSLGIPFFGLGRPGEAFGAGRLASTEATWEQNVSTLIGGAKMIFIIPSDHPGTLWEIRYIMEHRASERCVFVMPWMVRDFYGAEQWQSTRVACSQIGLELPEYISDGALLCQNRGGGWVAQSRLKRLVRRKHWLELAILDLLGNTLHSESGDVDLADTESDSVSVLATSDPVLITAVESLFEEAGIPYGLYNEGTQDLFGAGRLGLGFSLITGPIEIRVVPYWRQAAEDLLAELQAVTERPSHVEAENFEQGSSSASPQED